MCARLCSRSRSLSLPSSHCLFPVGSILPLSQSRMIYADLFSFCFCNIFFFHIPIFEFEISIARRESGCIRKSSNFNNCVDSFQIYVQMYTQLTLLLWLAAAAANVNVGSVTRLVSTSYLYTIEHWKDSSSQMVNEIDGKKHIINKYRKIRNRKAEIAHTESERARERDRQRAKRYRVRKRERRS